MAKQEMSNGLKFILEFGPIIFFFLGYMWLRDETFIVFGVEYLGFIAVTALFIPICVISMAVYWRLTGRLAKMQAITTVLVVVFGGLTIWFNDEQFFKMKPTVIYLLFATVFGLGLLKKKSVMQYALEDAMPLTHAGWMIMTRHSVVFFLALAVINELIWRNYSTDVWVSFKTFGLPVITAAFFIGDTYLLREHIIKTE